MKRMFNLPGRKSVIDSSYSDLISTVLNSPEVEKKNKYSKKELKAQEA